MIKALAVLALVTVATAWVPGIPVAHPGLAYGPGALPYGPGLAAPIAPIAPAVSFARDIAIARPVPVPVPAVHPAVPAYAGYAGLAHPYGYGAYGIYGRYGLPWKK